MQFYCGAGESAILFYYVLQYSLTTSLLSIRSNYCQFGHVVLIYLYIFGSLNKRCLAVRDGISYVKYTALHEILMYYYCTYQVFVNLH